jgi:hypothetical protein
MISIRTLTAVVLLLIVAVCLFPSPSPATVLPGTSIITPTDPPAETPAPAPIKEGRFGLGFSVGEFINMGILPMPVYGIYGAYAVSPSINLALQVGFVSGSSTGDDKAFDNATTFSLTPSAQFLFGNRKDFSPYIKVAFSYINYDITTTDEDTHKDETSSKNASSIWASAGLRYYVSDSFSVMGAMRFLDIGVSGDSKMSAFGLMNPSLSLEFTF